MPGKNLTDAFPSFFDLPVGYAGRASSIVVSETDFHRPRGQIFSGGKAIASESLKLDFEVEVGAFISHGNKHGESIDATNAEEHIFGLVLLNDWSARDIQTWECHLLGPLNGKNFCTSISPWVVPLEALEPFRTISMMGVSSMLIESQEN
jgi:fumarylacetoacetase